jgi:hypothetical protein
MISWDLASAMGRKQVFSKTGVDEALAQHRELLPKLFAMKRTAAAGKVLDAEEAVHQEEEVASSEEDERLEEFVGASGRSHWGGHRCAVLPAES